MLNGCDVAVGSGVEAATFLVLDCREHDQAPSSSAAARQTSTSLSGRTRSRMIAPGGGSPPARALSGVCGGPDLAPRQVGLQGSGIEAVVDDEDALTAPAPPSVGAARPGERRPARPRLAQIFLLPRRSPSMAGIPSLPPRANARDRLQVAGEARPGRSVTRTALAPAVASHLLRQTSAFEGCGARSVSIHAPAAAR
jgi:hypothetical protein